MTYRIDNIEVLLTTPGSAVSPEARWRGVNPGWEVLPQGYQRSPRHRAFAAETVWERDLAIPLRDGTVIRADVFRPLLAKAARIPALVVWSPYGKSGSGLFSLDLIPGRVGVAQMQLSGFESFEAPDPAEWTARGYAIVNVDVRGVLGSDGDVRWWGTGEGRDGYDAIEHIAQLPWCNGKCALVGNSWLAMAQWFIAAEQPPHLACIAPLEGVSDVYRETVCRGGVPYKPFWRFLSKMGIYGQPGRNKQEDVLGMVDQHPWMNAYWEDKRARLDRIKVPAYVLASYSTGLHTVGSFRGFQEIPHQNKWLRVHPTQEWHDLYQPDTIEDLQKFFDHYLKEANNGWENTPRVRLATLRFNQIFADWPIPNTNYCQLSLSTTGRLEESSPVEPGVLSYQSDTPALQVDNDPEELHFEYSFARQTRLIGYSKAVLYMSCDDFDDMDVFVQLRKASADGTLLQNINIPLQDLQITAEQVETVNSLKYLGPTGVLRASHRAIVPEKSTVPTWPFHPHDREERVPAGTVVKLEIGLWPTGILFEPGEKLILKVAGHQMTLAEFEPLRGQFQTNNHGRHQVHMGAKYPSHIVIPLVEL
ncbi:Alpha/Beta hydrolase protein [Aspergillus californicus]